MVSGILEKIFGSSVRVKIIRLFLLNPETLFSLKEISRRAKVNLLSTRREILLLKGIDFIKQDKKKKIQGLKLNNFFPLLNPLKNLVLNTAPLNKEKLAKMLNLTGKMKLIVLAGIFIQSDDSKVDVLLVGDSIRKGSLERILRKIESEIGKELIYAVFETKDFLYRFGMYDRFIRDILDYPHEKLVNKLNI